MSVITTTKGGFVVNMTRLEIIDSLETILDRHGLYDSFPTPNGIVTIFIQHIVSIEPYEEDGD